MLAQDLCRCHDATCHERQVCVRWTERENGGPYTPHSWSLYPLPDDDPGWDGVPDHGDPCPHKLSAP